MPMGINPSLLEAVHASSDSYPESLLENLDLHGEVGPSSGIYFGASQPKSIAQRPSARESKGPAMTLT